MGLAAQWWEWGIDRLTRTLRSLRREGEVTVVESRGTDRARNCGLAREDIPGCSRVAACWSTEIKSRSRELSTIWPVSASSWEAVAGLEQIEWFGRGPGRELPDRAARSPVARLALHRRRRIRPVCQAPGEWRPRGVRWLELSDGAGRGFRSPPTNPARFGHSLPGRGSGHGKTRRGVRAASARRRPPRRRGAPRPRDGQAAARTPPCSEYLRPRHLSGGPGPSSCFPGLGCPVRYIPRPAGAAAGRTTPSPTGGSPWRTSRSESNVWSQGDVDRPARDRPDGGRPGLRPPLDLGPRKGDPSATRTAHPRGLDDHNRLGHGDPSRSRSGLMVGANTFRIRALVAKIVHHSPSRRLGGRPIPRHLRCVAGSTYGSSGSNSAGRGPRPAPRPGSTNWSAPSGRDCRAEGDLASRARRLLVQGLTIHPLSVQKRLPILIGGNGRTKTLRTLAKYGDMWNAFGLPGRRSASSTACSGAATAEVARPRRDGRSSGRSTSGWSSATRRGRRGASGRPGWS